MRQTTSVQLYCVLCGAALYIGNVNTETGSEWRTHIRPVEPTLILTFGTALPGIEGVWNEDLLEELELVQVEHQEMQPRVE